MATRFEVRQGLSQADALCLVTEFEARGHKQSYGSEPGPATPPPSPEV
ncbi:MAG TPA: hypothetical protein VI542_30730 [Candidatus Tectomicrobia bacterium]